MATTRLTTLRLSVVASECNASCSFGALCTYCWSVVCLCTILCPPVANACAQSVTSVSNTAPSPSGLLFRLCAPEPSPDAGAPLPSFQSTRSGCIRASIASPNCSTFLDFHFRISSLRQPAHHSINRRPKERNRHRPSVEISSCMHYIIARVRAGWHAV